MNAQPIAKPHRGGAVLALGILGIAVFFVCGIIAWVMGNADLREMAAGTMDPKGRSITHTGMVCGIVGTIVNLVALVLIIWLLVGGAPDHW
jgi:hypothetical protein